MTETPGMVQVRVNPEHLAAVRAAVAAIPGGFARVASRAINRTMDSGRVRISREIASKTPLKVRQINSRFYRRRATRSQLNGFLGLSERPYDLRNFAPTFTPGAGVSVKVGKDRRTFLNRAFMVQRRLVAGLGWSKRSHWWGYGAVLMRRPTSGTYPRWDSGDMGKLAPRFPVVKVRGPSLADFWQQAPAMAADVVRYSQHTLEKHINDQVKLILKENGL